MDVFGRQNVDGVLDAGTNILRIKVWVKIANDLIEWNAFAYQLQYILHRDPCPSHARLAEVNIRIDRNSFFHGRYSIAE